MSNYPPSPTRPPRKRLAIGILLLIVAVMITLLSAFTLAQLGMDPLWSLALGPLITVFLAATVWATNELNKGDNSDVL